MKNVLVNPVKSSGQLGTDWTSLRPNALNMPATEDTTTADRLLYLKECLDKNLIDESLFRVLRDELTYGAGFA